MQELSHCEEMIMRILWSKDYDLSTQELIGILKIEHGKTYARTTVVTFFERLETKGYIERYRKGRNGYAKYIISKREYLNDLVSNWNGDLIINIKD